MCSTKKRFDCVAMKRKGAAAVYEATRGMSSDLELAFWREQETRLLPVRRRKPVRKTRIKRQHDSAAAPQNDR
jgi:hypothetical protein